MRSKFWLFLASCFCAIALAVGAGLAAKDTKLETATFAAGCFWKVQYLLSKVPGVVRTTVGYTGGKTDSPNYKQVCTKTTGHAEAVLVEYDPAKVSYKQLVNAFFANHNPTTMNRQGPDFGTQYRSAIFYNNEQQHQEALAVKAEVQNSGKVRGPIVTLIEPASKFYKAEEYHQNYFLKNGEVCH